MRERLRSIRYGLGDLGHAIVAPFRKLSTVARRRLVALVVLVAAIVLIVTVAVPALPCGAPGGDECAPDDEAIALVPGDAFVYAHANLDAETDEYADFAALAENLPLFSGQVADRTVDWLETSDDEQLDFDEDVRPWFGGEVAVALFGPVTAPEYVRLIEVGDAEGADDYASSLPSDEVGEQIGGFLVVGSEDGVAAIADVAEDDSLAANEEATSVRDELPEHRVVDIWLSGDGVREMVAPETAFSELSPLVAPRASEGAAASLGTSEDGDAFELAIRSSLDPKEVKSSPGFFAAFPGFEPELPERLPADSLAYLGFADPGKTVRSLVSQAGEEAPGIAESFTDLADSLRDEAALDLSDLLDALGDEAALTLDATSSSGSSSSAGQPFPYLSFIATDVDDAALREALAALQAPLGDVSSEQEIAGVDTRTLQISPTVSITYAIADGVAVAATSPDGIAPIVGGGEGDGLEESDGYAAATEDFPEEVSLIGYVNLGDLVGLAEELGLAEDPVYATFAGEFRQLDALGFEVSTANDVLATDARLLIGEPPSVDDAPSAIPAPPDD